MTDATARLAAALAGRYRIERELGQGGMARPVGGRAVDEARQPRGVAGGGQAVALTDFQRALLAALAAAPSDDRYLAGGAALHFAPTSTRYSDDLDFFHDTEARVASAFAADRGQLERAGYAVEIELSLPGFVRAVVRRGDDPLSLLELLKRRGRYRPEDFERLRLAEPFDLPRAKQAWLAALAGAEAFARERPPEESGCLYYSARTERFVAPERDASLTDQGLVPHFGAPGGVLPRMADSRIEGVPG
jgi:hypothetical protein